MAKPKPSGLLETVKTIIYAGLIAIGIRTVAFEPFNIPSASMEPTLLVGDYLFVSKYTYGYSRFSLPLSPNIFNGRILGRYPDRGDVVVFKFPHDTDTNYIKRVVGLPGDRVQVTHGQLLLNGAPVPKKAEGKFLAVDEERREVLSNFWQETFPDGNTHDILTQTDEGFANNTPEYKVPDGYVFCMGDNRDNSLDSRFMTGMGVGFVPFENLVGKAQFLFFSFDAKYPLWEIWEWPFEIRWNRLLHGIE